MANRDEVAEAMEKIVGHISFPHGIGEDRNGQVVTVTYEREWLEGGTTPVTDARGDVIEHKPNYKQRKLTQGQVEKLDAYIKSLGL